MTDPRYPIGKFEQREHYSQEEINTAIEQIQSLPARLAQAIHGLADTQLDTPYREGGWTLRQVVHHVADSHMNAYIRTKWTLTEEAPTIKAYLEKLWAETADNTSSPAVSIELLKSLHQRWVSLLKTLTTSQLHRIFNHPQTGKEVPLDRMIAMYAWHGDHHLTHIINLKKSRNW
jgi:hypothetical protein